MLDRDAGRCRFVLGDGAPSRWLEVGRGMLAGVDTSGTLVQLIATSVEVRPEFDHMGPMSIDPAD